MAYDLPDEVRVERDGPVRIVVLDRPDALNAVNLALHEALVHVWAQLDADPDARAVVLTGAGRAFSAGGDFGWIERISQDDESARVAITDAERLIRAMLDFRLPVVAAVNGPAVGLGCSLTVLSDLVLMAPDAYLSDPHVGVGLVAGDGGVLWPFLTGMHVAKEFLFLGRKLSAEEAVRIGLANRVVEADVLLDEALTLARRLAAMPARALQDTKRALNSLLLSAWPSVQFAAATEQVSMRSAEHHDRLREVMQGQQRTVTDAVEGPR